MNNFPKGNDLIVKWAIKYSDGTPFPLENYAWELCYSAGRGINVVKDTAVISVSDNLLTWRFSGKDQVFYGKYSLTLRLYQQGKIVATVSKNNAFELSTTQYDGSCDIDLVSYCDNISLQDALLRGNKAMEVAQDAKVIAGSAVNTAGAAVTTANEAKSIANTANATSTEAKTIAGNAKTVADQAKTTADAAAATATQKAEEVAQKEAQLEAALNNLSPDQSGALALSTKVNEHGEKLSELNEKVDALALGAFYGYFPDSSSLPVDMTTPGYAYVGLDNPYKIWNFNGKSWSDSGTSIDMNDADEEDITRNADGKLQFKDRAYGDGMGYIILRKNKTFAEQVTQSNTIYEIRYVFDLGGASVTIPAGCTLKFVGSKLSNGTITGNTTIISGTPSFANVAFAGTFDLRYIDAKWFDYTNSAEKIDAVFRLATSVTKGNIVVNLEAGVTYDLDYALHTSAIIISAKWSFNSVNNIIINGNGATLHHINPISDIPSDQTLDGILLFYNCRNVIVTGLKYISDVGAQVYTASTAPKGCTFIKIQGYGSNYNIDIEAEYAAYAVNQSLFPLSALERVGLITGSRFHIIANKSRYGFASSWMEDCDIYVHSEGNHRACYLSGASRCKVRVETSESYVAPHPCLLQQSRVLDEGGNVKYLFNSDIDISVTYVGSGNNPSTIYLVGFGSYGKELYEITTRPAIHSKNIRISVNIPVDTTNVYGVAMLYSEETDYIAAGDTFDNISVYVDCFSNATTGFYWISPNDVAFNNFNVVLVNGNATLYCGTLTKITFKNSSISTLNMAGADIILDNSRVNAASLLVSTQGNQNNTKKVRYINGGGMDAISGTDAAGRIIFKLGDYEYVDYWQVQNKIDVNSDHIIIIDNTGNPLMWKSAGWEHLATIASKGTAYRPGSGIYPGYLYFDTDLKKMILWNGSAWTNIDGTALE